MSWWYVPAAFALAGLVALYLTPLLRQVALHLGVVDRPDGKLKQQPAPVPYLGGVAVFLAYLLSSGLFLQFDARVLAILLAGTLALLVGLVDDFGALSPLPKLLGLGVAVFALLRAGVLVELVELPFALHWVLAAFWLLLVANAFNLVDVMDGLASGLALIAAVGISLASFLTGQGVLALMAASLAGALLGFLPANLAPARMYLGDAGSLALGMTLGALALAVQWSEVSPAGFLAPVAFLALPLSEVGYLVLLRARRRLPFWRGSPDHFALRWRQLRRGDVRGTAWRCWAVGGLFALAGLALTLVPQFEVSLAVFLALALGWALWLLRLSLLRMGP
ncbi:MAG: undecaprenyl/decaprenyl-phosphate alpha-N-acetylglucosaminyl 1-phosphate transferase [Thermoanaerobaculum sp.]|nr:undecaprenyl/decaprenyl-phosphate alpha-N-acetylglucosaminyl 1-phosphate transferase [Thermoanaerobaculum sp.]